MATVIWTGSKAATAQLDTITVGSATATETFVATINAKTVTYVAGSGETTTTVAAALAALLAAEDDGEFAELDFEASAATILVTGPDDGRPFTLTVDGTGTISTTTTTSPVSPHDLAAGGNYSGGSLPSNGDTLVFEDSAVGVFYGLTALASVALASIIRRSTFTGGIGLPTTNPNGYREYRTTEMSVNSALALVEQSQSDSAGQYRLNFVTTAVAVTVVGEGGGQGVGNESLEIRGMPATSTLSVTGGSVAVCPLAGQTGTAATLRAIDSTVRTGSGATTTTVTLQNCQALLGASVTTLTVNGGGETDVRNAAAVTTLTIDGGRVRWRSTGSFGTPTIGGGGTLDLSQAPAAVAAGGTITLNAGAALIDPAGRITTSYNIALSRCNVGDVSIDVGTGKSLAVS